MLQVSVRAVAPADEEVVRALLAQFYEETVAAATTRHVLWRYSLPRWASSVALLTLAAALLGAQGRPRYTAALQVAVGGCAAWALECWRVSRRSKAEMVHFVSQFTDLSDITATYAADGHAFLVAEAVEVPAAASGAPAPEVVGCAGLKPVADRPGTMELVRLCVRPDLRSRRIGAELLAHLEAKGRALGYDTVTLRTNARLASAVRFYQRNGFKHTDTLVRPALLRGDLLFYERPLGGEEDSGGWPRRVDALS